LTQARLQQQQERLRKPQPLVRIKFNGILSVYFIVLTIYTIKKWISSPEQKTVVGQIGNVV
ncbi:MAG: hypothetical protein AAF349_22935, partial [Cyanobacteria bacterium P01_A01_bin.68]